MRYADVGWFVPIDGAIDREAWTRGTSFYLPDGKIPLYPSLLCDGAASLLPDGERPAIIFTVRVDPAGEAKLDRATRSRNPKSGQARLRKRSGGGAAAGFGDLTRRIEAAEQARGAARVEPPEQEVVQENGCFRLQLRPQSWAEQKNAALSLATNLAVAAVMLKAKTGLFRTMPEPQDWAVRRLRHTAKALGVGWQKSESLQQLERRLNSGSPADAAMMLAIRRASPAAGYEPFRVTRTVACRRRGALRACHGTAPAPGRPLCHRGGFGDRERRAGILASDVRAIARGHAKG